MERRKHTMLVVFNIVWFVILLMTLSLKWSPYRQSVGKGFMKRNRSNTRPTMLPVMRGEGKAPLTTMAAREKPSGATSALEMTRSATGPMAANAEAAKRTAK